MTAAGKLDAPEAPSDVDTINIAVVQTESRYGQWQRNIDMVAETVRRLAAEGSDIIVLPEFFATGYDLEGDIRSIAEEVPGRTSDA
ncbi:MAG: nitrilase-related carbon-nitrogen hydrolase, partial [Rhodococcus sp. (in: high G+C Gram-positive bacteria)]|uniref:nitrilase-related carbon-nitrogen hydrolase n=1 Tax=Rhodococcus sp. TaxID=1831 RepID=UPI003D9B96A7